MTDRRRGAGLVGALILMASLNELVADDHLRIASVVVVFAVIIIVLAVAVVVGR